MQLAFTLLGMVHYSAVNPMQTPTAALHGRFNDRLDFRVHATLTLELLCVSAARMGAHLSAVG